MSQTVKRCRRGRRRRGFAEPATTLAVVSAVLTLLNLGVSGRRGTEGAIAAEEFRDNMTEVAEGLQEILQSKYDRMRREGKMTEAEYALATHRMNQDLASQAMSDTAQELANRQRELAQNGFWNLMTSATTSVLYSAAGEGGEAAARFVPALKDKGILDGLFSIISGVDDIAGGAPLAVRNPYLLTTDEVKQAIEKAEQRIQGGRESMESSDSRFVLSQRIKSFFDQWCLKNEVDRYKDEPNHETWVKRYRSQFQERVRKDFEALLKEISREGWSLHPVELDAMAWEILTTSKAYQDTFGRDWSGEYTFEVIQEKGEKKDVYHFRLEDHRDGTADGFFSLPPEVKVEDLRKLGLPPSREWRFPLVAKIDSNRSCEEAFNSSGPEVQALFRAIARVICGVEESIRGRLTGDNKQASLVDRAGAENCLLSLRIVQEEDSELAMTLSAVLLIPSLKDSKVEMKRKDYVFNGTARRVP